MSAVMKNRIDQLTRVERLALGHIRKPKKSNQPFNLNIARLREIEKNIRSRFGQFIPETDDGDLYIEAAILSLTGQDMLPWCRRWAPWAVDRYSEVVEPLLKRHGKRRYQQSADACAKMLCLTMAERTALEIKTIGASDLTKAARKKLAAERKKEQDRTRAAQNRKSAGVKNRASYEAESLSQTKPWEALNMTRATWYRKGKPTSETGLSLVEYRDIGDTLVSTPEKAPQIVPPRPLSTDINERVRLTATEGGVVERSEGMVRSTKPTPTDSRNLPSRPSGKTSTIKKAG